MLGGWNISIGFSQSKNSPTTSECPSPPSTHGDTDTKVHPDSASVAMSASDRATSKSGSTTSSTKSDQGTRKSSYGNE